jgi:hypothetical protein
VPDACTLSTVDRPLRVAEFDSLFASDVRSVDRLSSGRVRLELRPDPAVASRTANLAARETGCCAFFGFTLVMVEGRLTLDVTATPAHTDVLAALADRAEALAGRPA